MKVMQRTGRGRRTTLSLSRHGVTATYWRPKSMAYGGGWYPSNRVTVEWPWKKVN